MIPRIVVACLKSSFIVLVAALAIAIGGVVAYRALDIEAYPDPVQPDVEVTTQPPGWSAEEVERQVTIPLEIGFAGMPGLDVVRTISEFALSDVKCYFGWDSSYWADRQEVINRLQFMQLPAGAQPLLNPENPIGEIYRYYLVGRPDRGADPERLRTDLKTADDWIVEKAMRLVPGVEDDATWGGLTKEFSVEVDPYRLQGYGVSLPQLMSSIANGNTSVGGSYLPIGSQSYNVRGIGFIKSLAELEQVPLSAAGGTPIRVGEVATVKIGHEPRLGIIGLSQVAGGVGPDSPAIEDGDIVEGIVLMRKGENTLATLQGVDEKVAALNSGGQLPAGMHIVPYYDRSWLVHLTTHTVLENLAIGFLLVVVILFFFLNNLRGALIVALMLPLALCVALIGLVLTKTPANLISLGAVDFGIVVDSSVIMLENIFRRLGHDRESPVGTTIVAAAREVGRPMAYATSVILVAFLPLWLLHGVEGVIFSPMAHTYAFALAGGICLAVTLVPTLSKYVLRPGLSDEENGAMRRLRAVYVSLFRRVLAWPRATVAITLLLLAGATVAFLHMGSEFMPKLEEWNLWVRATLPNSVSLQYSSSVADEVRQVFMHYNAEHQANIVQLVVSQTGRPDDGTDVAGFYDIEFSVQLEDPDKVPRWFKKQAMVDEISDQLAKRFPGVIFNFSQNIQDNVEEAMSGVKGSNSVKVIGTDLAVLSEKAHQVEGVLSTVAGIHDLGTLDVMGQPNILITPNREYIARRGINVGDVEAVVQAAIGGQAVTQVLEGERHFDLVVRLAPEYRASVSEIRRILVSAPDGSQIPLGELADIRTSGGASIVYRERNQRYVPVKFSVRGRDLGSTLAEAQQKIAAQVHLPRGYRLEWAGEFKELQEARGWLAYVVPLTILVMALLLYVCLGNIAEMLIALAQIPLALLGGVVALALTGTPFSISAAVGFISVLGIAIQDGLIITTYVNQLWAQGASYKDGIVKGAEQRLRPRLMTAMVASLGLLPAAVSDAVGAQAQKPLAVVILGGAFSVALLTGLFMPALMFLSEKGNHARRYGANRDAAAEGSMVTRDDPETA